LALHMGEEGGDRKMAWGRGVAGVDSAAPCRLVSCNQPHPLRLPWLFSRRSRDAATLPLHQHPRHGRLHVELAAHMHDPRFGLSLFTIVHLSSRKIVKQCPWCS
jgi:hypothetical protein